MELAKQKTSGRPVNLIAFFDIVEGVGKEFYPVEPVFRRLILLASKSGKLLNSNLQHL